MRVRHFALKKLYAAPYFRGRDRLIGLISESFVGKPLRLPSGMLMELDAQEWIQLEILARGTTEPLTTALFKSLLGEGDTVIDVGAHVGHHTLIQAAEVGKSGRVFAFDPQPYNCDRIARNAQHNGFSHVVVICAAVGDRDDFTRSSLQSNRDRARLSLAEDGPNDLSILIETPIRRLDTFMEGEGLARIKLLKIDVEGFELAVIEGLGDRLRDCQNIVLELLGETGSSTKQRIVGLLSDAGFVLKTVEGKPWRPDARLPESNLWATRSPASKRPNPTAPTVVAKDSSACQK